MGIRAPSTRTGITSTSSRRSAVSTSFRRTSSGSQIRGLPVPSPRRQPLRPDDHEHRPARLQRPPDPVSPLLPRLDGDDVDEHAVLPEATDQPVVQPPRVPGGILAPVADEHSRLCLARMVSPAPCAGLGRAHDSSPAPRAAPWRRSPQAACSCETSPSTRSASSASGRGAVAYGPACVAKRNFSCLSRSQVAR